jgi:hypothetical protein
MKKKRMIMKILKRNDLYENFEKKGGSREKGGGGNEIHAPCACVFSYIIHFHLQ